MSLSDETCSLNTVLFMNDGAPVMKLDPYSLPVLVTRLPRLCRYNVQYMALVVFSIKRILTE